MTRLSRIKKDELFATGIYNLKAFDECNTVVGTYEKCDSKITGVFSMKNNVGSVEVDLPDGKYTDLIYDKEVEVAGGKMNIAVTPVIIKS